jgi:hypothetical protein
VPVTENTRKADEKLREKLKHVDSAKLKTVLKALVDTPADTARSKTFAEVS